MDTPATDSHITENISVDATRLIARFALADHEFSPMARLRALDAITDCTACMLAGGAEALAAPLRKLLATSASPVDELNALVIGTGRHATPADAALHNSALAHALDYDDTNHPAYAHPSAVLVPTLLALAPRCEANGADLIDAYIAGFEIFGKLGRALNTQHYKRGWHATGTFGALAAVVCAGRLLRLTDQQMTMAIGIAASAASGLRANFGSMVKPLHAGYASRNGILAALLAREGFDACTTAMEHRYGYLSVFNDGIGHATAPFTALGLDLEILTEHGLALKPFPACGATHPGIEAALSLREEIGDSVIDHIEVGVCEMSFAPLIHVVPHSPLEGKFSLHYCIAAALVFGELDLRSFTPDKISDARVLSLIERIHVKVDERWRDDSEFSTEVVVHTTDGRRLASHVPLAIGKPARWFSEAQLRAKFDDCTSKLDTAASSQVWRALRELDTSRPPTALLSSLEACHVPAA
jgi:2-methylcitrate dehydratase PrpD